MIQRFELEKLRLDVNGLHWTPEFRTRRDKVTEKASLFHQPLRHQVSEAGQNFFLQIIYS